MSSTVPSIIGGAGESFDDLVGDHPRHWAVRHRATVRVARTYLKIA
jgi:hypothetical protein